MQVAESESTERFAKEFMKIMVVVLPYIKEQKNGFTMHSLVELSGKDVKTFYEEVSANLYKSPRR